MWPWKLSYIILQLGWLTACTNLDGLRGGREEVDLEAVQVFDGHPGCRGLGFFGGALERFDPVLELVLGRPLAREDSDRRVDRPAEDLTAERLAALHHAVEVDNGRSANLRIGAIGFVSGHHRDRRRAQAQALDPLAKALERARLAVSKMGTSTASKPSDLIWSRIASCCR